MGWTAYHTDVRDTLAGLYFEKSEVRRVAQQAGLRPAMLDLDGRVINAWHNTVVEADNRHKVDDLIAIALKEYPENEHLRRVLLGQQRASKAPAFVDLNEADQLQWHDGDDVATLEKIIGSQSTLLPISFLEAGCQKSRPVARVLRDDGTCGTGFLTRQNLLVTNHHVIPDRDAAATAKIQFNYQKNVAGRDLVFEEYQCRPDDVFLTSVDDDWTVVRLAGDPNSKWGAIPLDPASVAVRDRVIIIQHPGGDHKAIGLYHNLVTYAGAGRVQYLTDTMPGSSGAPVFDNNWNLVAVHHSGGWLREPGSKTRLFRNEGIAVDVLVNGASVVLAAET